MVNIWGWNQHLEILIKTYQPSWGFSIEDSVKETRQCPIKWISYKHKSKWTMTSVASKIRPSAFLHWSVIHWMQFCPISRPSVENWPKYSTPCTTAWKILTFNCLCPTQINKFNPFIVELAIKKQGCGFICVINVKWWHIFCHGRGDICWFFNCATQRIPSSDSWRTYSKV